MLSTTRTRLALSAAAAAAVIGGLFVAAPANAATPEITLANSIFTVGSWGTGLDVSGSGFTPDTTVTITVRHVPEGSIGGQHVVTADATGAFANEVFTPTYAPSAPDFGSDYVTDTVVEATSTDGDTSNTIVLDVRHQKGIHANSTIFSTEQLADPSIGLWLAASGYTPGEDVWLSSTLDAPMPAVAHIADRYGTVALGLYLAQGTIEAGEIGFTLTGQTSGVANSITITVTGDTINTGPPQIAPVPAPVPPQGPTGKLPRVSG